MKKYLFILGIAAFSATAFITSCKKENTTLDPKEQQFITDANDYKSEADQADNDINNALGDMPGFKNGGSVPAILSSPLCGVTIDSSLLAQKIVVFNFDGVTPCFSPSRTRSGQIRVQLTSGTHWGDAGAVITETFINFKVTRLSDNKSIMFNGVKTLRNINGNDWIAFLLSTKSLKYQERAFNVAVSFDNNTSATWNSARITEWNYVKANTIPDIPYAHIAFTANGDTTINGYSSADTWGVNRYGYNFTTNYSAPILSNTYCGLWRFNSGELVHHVNNEEFKLTLGVDVSGNPTPYTCAYGFKVSWTSSGNNNSIILSY